MIGTNTSQISAQVTNIEHDGFWLLVGDGEYFVAFEDYPDFRDATIAQINNFKHLFDALKHPDRFPHKFKR
jgi:hypothetical protein